MEVEIDINKKDHWNFNKYVIFNVPRQKRSFILNMLCGPLFSYIAICILTLSFYSFIIGTVILDLYIFYSYKMRVMSQLKYTKGILGKHIIEINENGIKETTEIDEGFAKWRGGIDGIKQDKNNVYIFLDTFRAHIIPKRSFASEAETNQFYNKALIYWLGANKDIKVI